MGNPDYMTLEQISILAEKKKGGTLTPAEKLLINRMREMFDEEKNNTISEGGQ